MQTVLHLLERYSKSAVSAPPVQEGSSFAQRGGSGSGNTSGSGNGNGIRGDGRDGDTFNKKYWKDLTCYKCDKKGHPASHCPPTPAKTAREKAKERAKDNDDRSRSSSSSKASIAKLQKDLKKTKKSFTALQSKIDELQEESDLSGSDEEASSHFQMSRPHKGAHQSTGVPAKQMSFYEAEDITCLLYTLTLPTKRIV